MTALVTMPDVIAARMLDPDTRPWAHLVNDLLEARDEHSGGANRRRLFAAIDDLLGTDGVHPASGAPTTEHARRRGPIVFRHISLRNWKVFDRAEFCFPANDASTPVVLIGGQNGFGKTSIMQAVLHGLYGRQAPGPVGAATMATGDGGRPSRGSAYDDAIARALHLPARDRGERLMSVRVTLDTEEGSLVVDRRWHVDMLGSRLEDEELTVAVGEEETIVPLPDGEDALAFYQDYVHRRVAPASLAPFFLFDGEQVAQLAERHIADQVRLGVEGAIGMHRFRGLAADLRDYARDRDRDSVATEVEARLRAEVERLRADLDAGEAGLAGLMDRLRPVLSRRDAVVGELGAASSGTHEDMSELLERSHRLAAEVTASRIDLASAVTSDLPLMLCGDLVEKVRGRIVAEADVGSPDPVGDAGRLALFLQAFDAQEPRMPASESGPLHERIAMAWGSPPFASLRPTLEVRHHHLSGSAADHVLARIGAVVADGTTRVRRACSGHLSLREQTAANDARLAARRDGETRATGALAELERLNAEVSAIEGDRRDADRHVGRVRADLDAKLGELERRGGRRASTTKAARSDRASRIADEIDGLIVDTARAHFGSVADRITDAYRAMAHKSVVDKITVDEEGNVTLLDKGGRSLGSADPSAGESQIFAMALIAAVMDLGGARLPVMVDTPLGRLDPEHRERVLAFFTSRPGQTILLSQPDEVNQRYLSLIRHRIGASFHLEHRGATSDRLGGSAPRPGYFPDLAA